MNSKKKKEERPEERKIERKSLDATPQGVILERFKRMTGLPSRNLDTMSEFFRHNYLRSKSFF